MLPLPKLERSGKVFRGGEEVSAGTAKGCRRRADPSTVQLPAADHGLRRISVVSFLGRNSGLSISGSLV